MTTKLFKISNDKSVKEIKNYPHDEKQLQGFLEENLKTIFNLTKLASEFFYWRWKW